MSAELPRANRGVSHDASAGKQDEFGSSAGASGLAAVSAGVVAEMHAGRLLEAQLRCRRALEASPEEPELLHMMALICLDATEFDHVVEWASRAIRKDPKPTYLTTLGTALLKLRRHDDAVKVFDMAVQLGPADPGSWSNLGEALVDAGYSADAIGCFARALQIDPHRWDAAYKSGMLLRQQGRFEEALVCFDSCERLRPGQAPTLHLRALVLDALGRFEESLRDNRRAHQLDPENPYVSNCLGHNLMQLDRHEEALPWFDRTVDLTDFIETAALVSCLDLVITVDTSVAHLAGALGRPTWVLLPHTPDYRWLLDRDDSPWYPTARLFRQTTARDYEGVVDRVRTELVKLIETDRSSRL